MMSSFVPRVTLPDSVLDLPWLTIIQPWPLPVRISYNRIYCTLQQKLHPTVTWFSKSNTPVTIDDKDGPELTSSCKLSSSLSMFTRSSQTGKTNRPMQFDLLLLVATFALCWCIVRQSAVDPLASDPLFIPVRTDYTKIKWQITRLPGQPRF